MKRLDILKAEKEKIKEMGCLSFSLIDKCIEWYDREIEAIEVHGAANDDYKDVAQADGDLISKSKLVMYLNDWRFGVAPDETTPIKEQDKRLIIASTIYDFMKVVEELPSVAIPSAEPKWIPVSEKLPSDCNEDWVLAQIQEDNGYLWIPCVAEYREDFEDWWTDANWVGWLKKHDGALKVIAWMPLPEPYKEEV